MTVERDGAVVFAGETSTERMVRTCEELCSWLIRHNDVPDGTVMLTGTGIVPPDDFTLAVGDVVRIEVGELALEIEGGLGVLVQGDSAVPDDGLWQRHALSWPEVVIGGGTPNIQKNIIAERVLGLPKD